MGKSGAERQRAYRERLKANPEVWQGHRSRYNAQRRERYADSEYRFRRDEKLRKLGLTWDAYQKMYESQGGLCPVCSESLPSIDEGQRGIHVDHDHNCCPSGRACSRCIRGLLHNVCNTAIGKLRDDPEVFHGAAVHALKRVDVLSLAEDL